MALLLGLQIFWWLTWLDEFNFEDSTLFNICDKVFETLEKKFKPTVVRFLISLLITSRDGLKETELIELMKDSKLVEGNSNLAICCKISLILVYPASIAKSSNIRLTNIQPALPLNSN